MLADINAIFLDAVLFMKNLKFTILLINIVATRRKGHYGAGAHACDLCGFDFHLRVTITHFGFTLFTDYTFGLIKEQNSLHTL